jgi:hypothetical protein
MTARINAPKTGGRRKGGIDREARKLLTDQMSADLMTVYQKLGGVKWLLKFAEDNPAEFLRQGLSRLFPAPAKDDPDVVNNTQINFDLNPMEAARRVAFALNLGLHAQRQEQQGELIEAEEITPQRACDWRDPVGQIEPSPEPVDPDRLRWAEELPLTEEQRRDNAAIRQTLNSSLENYAGSSAEQGGCGPASRAVVRKPSAAELCRRLNRSRRDELL